MSENEEKDSNPAEEAELVWGVAIDLDFAAVKGVETLENVCDSVFKDAGIPFDSNVFSRFIIGAPVMQGIVSMLTAAGQSKEKALPCVEPINRKFAERIVSAAPLSLAAAAAKKTVKLGGKAVAFTCLDGDAASALAVSAGLPAEVQIFHANRSGFGSYDSGTIRAAVASAGISPRRCITIAGTSTTARSALMANTNVAAVTVPYTEFQDFAGTDFVCDADAAKEADKIVDLVVSRLK